MIPRQVGNYRLDSLLGAGGMGEVYRAYDTRRDRYVALKLLPEAFSGDQEYLKRFKRESYVAARLTEPHVIPIHDFGEIDGQLFIDMRLVEGTDIGALLDANGRIPAQQAVHLIEQVAQALDAAHADNLVHRDIKPSNILVTTSDFVYVVDFGIARTVGGRQTALTITGATMGTLHYMAPERFIGHDVDGRADVYSLACVLHECLTGTTPFGGKELAALMYAQLHHSPPAASSLVDGVPQALDAVIARGMAKNPDDRFPTAGDLAEAARAAVLSEEPAAASPMTQLPTGAWADMSAPTRRDVPVLGAWQELPQPPAPEPEPAGSPFSDYSPTQTVTAAGTGNWGGPQAPEYVQPPEYVQQPPQYTPQPPQYAQQPPQYAQQPPQYAQQPPEYMQQAPQYMQQPTEYNMPPTIGPGPGGGYGPPYAAAGRPERGRGRGRLALLILAIVAIVAIPVVIITLASHRSHTNLSPSGLSSTGTGSAGASGSASASAATLALPVFEGKIPVGQTPSFVQVAPNGKFAYIANPGAGTITVLNTANDLVSGTIKIPQGPPQFVSFSPDSQTAYVSVYKTNGSVHLIAFVNTATDAITATVPVNNFTPTESATSPDGRFLYVPNHNTAMSGANQNVLDVIDTTTKQLIGSIPVSANPHWVVFGKNNGRFYTTDHMSATVTVLNAQTNAPIAEIEVGETPHSEALSPDGSRLAVTSYDGNVVYLINTATDKKIATIPVGQEPVDIAYSPDGRYLLTVNSNDNTVTVIDTADNHVIGKITTGKSPTSISVLPNGRQAYVTDEGDGTVEILNFAK